MATVLGSVWPGPLAIYAHRLSNYFFIYRMAKKTLGRVKLESVPGTTMDHVINATYIAAFLANLLANKYNGTKMWFQGRNGTRKTFAVQFLFLYLMLLNSSFLVWNVHLTLIVVVFTDGDDVEACSVLLHHT